MRKANYELDLVNGMLQYIHQKHKRNDGNKNDTANFSIHGEKSKNFGTHGKYHKGHDHGIEYKHLQNFLLAVNSHLAPYVCDVLTEVRVNFVVGKF